MKISLTPFALITYPRITTPISRESLDTHEMLKVRGNKMSSATKTALAEPAGPSLDTLRDELTEAHKPADGCERMLVTQIAQTWLRMQRAQQAEDRYCATRDMVEVLTTKLAEFKAVTRWATDCERAWRHAVTMLKAAQRRRERESKTSSTARRTHPSVSASAPVSTAAASPVLLPFAAARRE